METIKKHLFDSPLNPKVKAEEDIEEAADVDVVNNSEMLEMSNTPGKPTAIVKPHSDSMETGEKTKKPKKPLPPKPWLKKKKKNPSTTPSKPASSGSYNLDFLDKLDDPNFDPFTTKTKVTNDSLTEEQPLPKPSSGYNLDFLDQMDDPNFNPFETKTKVVNENSEIEEKSPEKIQEKIEIPPNKSEKIEKVEENLEILHLEPKENFQHFQQEEEPMVPPKPAFDFEPSFEIPKFQEDEKFDEAENFDFDHFNTKSSSSKAATPIDLPLLEMLEPKKKKDSTPEFEKAEAEMILNCEEQQSVQKPQRVLSDKVKEELARNELIFQAQLLDKDKELHAKEKQVQMVDHEVHKLKMELKSLTEGNVEMM